MSPIKEAIEALEMAKTGLEWYRDRCPDAVDGSDGEADEQIDAALAALRSMPQGEPVACELDQALKERDDAQDMADQLADQIAAITGTEIGEHTSANDPWRNAMLAADEWIAEDLRRMFDGRQEQPRPPVAHRLRNAPSEIDYDLLIAACYEQTRQAQGTKGCVQFAKGAEWYRELISATPHTEAVRMSEAEERAAFEVWVNEQPEGVSKKWWCRQIDDGGYSCYEADLTWRAWKARAVEQATAARLGVTLGDV